MGSILEKIGALLNQKQLSDEQLLDETAKREARGGASTEKQAEAVADALHRLGKDQNFLAGKIALVREHDQAVEAEARHNERAAKAAEIRAQHDAIDAEIAPLVKRRQAVADVLAPLEQQCRHDQATIVGKAAGIRAGNPGLFADAG